MYMLFQKTQKAHSVEMRSSFSLPLRLPYPHPPRKDTESCCYRAACAHASSNHVPARYSQPLPPLLLYIR